MPTIAAWLSCDYDAVLVVDETDVAPKAKDGSRFIHGAFVDVPVWDQSYIRASGRDVDVKIIADKKHSETQPALRLIGLVDSELWLVRRVLAQQGPGGRTYDQAFRDREARDDNDSEETVLSQEVVDREINDHPCRQRYVNEVLRPLMQDRVLRISDEA